MVRLTDRPDMTLDVYRGNNVSVGCVLHRLPYRNARVQVVPEGNSWVRANCSAHDDLRPVKMYLMNVANE